MTMANALGIAIFVLIFSHGIKEIEREEKFLEHTAMSVQKNNVACQPLEDDSLRL